MDKEKKRIAFITCITAGYESTLKEPAQQTVPCDFIAYVDKEYRAVPSQSAWQVRPLEHHHHETTTCHRNSIANNEHSFNIAKYYKCMFHTFPELQAYEVVVWLDGTIKITNPQCAEQLLVITTKSISPALFGHEHRNNYVDEAKVSHFERYTSTSWNHQSQPYQDVDAQAAAYMAKGCPPMSSGLWITCFVAWNMRSPFTREALELWYHEILQHTTQDQISFPFVMWKLGLKPNTIPGETAHTQTVYYDKEPHGL